MSFLATLKIEGKGVTYNILKCEYTIEQDVDDNKKPIAIPSGGTIEFTIFAPDDSDTFFHEWILSKSDGKNGEFKFPILVDGVNLKYKTLKFEKTHCTRLVEKFSNLYLDDDETPTQMLMEITLQATELTFGGDANQEKYTNNEKLGKN